MIQINVATTTRGGLPIPSGSLLNVKPKFIDYVDENGLTKYDITYDVDIYEDMAEYQAKKILVRDYVVNYDIAYVAKDVNIQLLDSVSALLDIYKTVIENGSEGYPGVGVGNTALVYPPTV